MAGNAAEAEDAAQDAFVKAYRALGRFRRGSPFRPWLLQIVANEARNRRRSAGRRAALALRAAGRILGGRGSVPRGEPARRRGSRAPAGRVNALREEERLVIACRYFLDLSEDETAAALGVRRGTVKSRTSRALEHLRESWGRAMPELDVALRQLGAAIEFPPEPDLAAGVRRRIGEAPSRRGLLGGWSQSLSPCVVVAIGAVLAVPSARTAVLEWLGLEGVRVTRVGQLPKVSLLSDRDLGEPVTLAEARRRAPGLVEPHLKNLGAPDEVYFSAEVPGGQITFLWGTKSATRLLLTESPQRDLHREDDRPAHRRRGRRRHGRPGVWFSGTCTCSSIAIAAATCARRPRAWRATRSSGSTATSPCGSKGDLSKKAALEIARSVR